MHSLFASTESKCAPKSFRRGGACTPAMTFATSARPSVCFASAAEWQMLNDSTERLPSADDSSPLETPAVAYDTHATPSGVWKDVRLHPHVRARVQCIELHARKPRDHPVLHASMHPCTPALASRGLCVGLFAPTSMGWGFWEMKRGSQFGGTDNHTPETPQRPHHYLSSREWGIGATRRLHLI